MKKDPFLRVVNFLLGASWAIIVLGAMLTFKFFIYFGISSAIFTTFIFIFFSLFFVLFLDMFIVNKQRLQETKKQTELLEKIASKLEEKELD
jgi:membrane-bound ClpP family serine protease